MSPPNPRKPRAPRSERLSDAVRDAFPMLVQGRLIDAAAVAQAAAGGVPVTSEQVRERLSPPMGSTSRAFADLCRRVTELPGDERGRRLVACGLNRTGSALWWAQIPDPREARIAELVGSVARPGEGLLDVLQRALEALARSEPPNIDVATGLADLDAQLDTTMAEAGASTAEIDRLLAELRDSEPTHAAGPPDTPAEPAVIASQPFSAPSVAPETDQHSVAAPQAPKSGLLEAWAAGVKASSPQPVDDVLKEIGVDS